MPRPFFVLISNAVHPRSGRACAANSALPLRVHTTIQLRHASRNIALLGVPVLLTLHDVEKGAVRPLVWRRPSPLRPNPGKDQALSCSAAARSSALLLRVRSEIRGAASVACNSSFIKPGHAFAWF